jgi:uncharacterized integral membrane protein
MMIGMAGHDRNGAEGEPEREPTRPVERTRTGGIWVAVVVAAVVLVFLLVFVVQNSDSVTVRFLWTQGSLPLGIGMLFAAIAGALLVGLVGTARILQLRRAARHRLRRPD